MIRAPSLLALALMLAACGDASPPGEDNKILVTGQSVSKPGRPAPKEVVGQDFVSAVLGHFDFAQASAKLASERAGLPAVQSYAQKVTADLDTARAELATIAGADGLELKAAAGETDSTDLAVLSSSRGQPLAKAFAERQMETLTQLVGTMRAYKNGGDNPRLRAWAEKHQGPLNDRLLDAQTLNAEAETALLPAGQR